MFWPDELVNGLVGKQVVNDSKTLSGRAHVGSLRGVIVHDVVYRAALDKGIDIDFYFGSDDYDAFDSVPPYIDAEIYSQYLGYPLCNVPSPDGTLQSYADYFANEFFSVANKLGAFPITYRMSELYRSGKMNEPIKLVLENASLIREIYYEVNKSEKADNWLPFSVICENCGKIATTHVYNFDGDFVYYICAPDGASYVQGCGYQGRISPFNGNGKLPWKLEWSSRWIPLGVTIEGAGIDHSVAGGSREVTEAVYKRVFNREPPLNIPYEFMLVDSKKMSSSKGLGYSAKDVSDILPPEILRFLLVRTRPQRTINFRLDGNTIPDLFDEYDKFADEYTNTRLENASDNTAKRIFELSQPKSNQIVDARYYPRFTYLATLIQIPGIDLKDKLESNKGSILSSTEWTEVERRSKYVRYWLENFAPEHFRIQIAENVPDASRSLSQRQVEILDAIADWLAYNEATIDGEDIHNEIHEISKRANVKDSVAFQAIYISLLGRNSGPRAGNLLEALDRDFVVKRFRRVKMMVHLSTTTFNILEKRRNPQYRNLMEIHTNVMEKFPDLRIGIAGIRGVEVTKGNPDLESLKNKIVNEIQKRYSGVELGVNKRIQAYRTIYRSFGVDPNSRNPSAEALIRRIVRGRGLYNINNIVDVYNLSSAEVAIPMAAYNTSAISFPIELRFAHQGELHYPIGATEPTILQEGELVYADQKNIICQDFNYRDSDLTKVTSETKDIILFVDGCGVIPHEEVQNALETTISRIIQFAGGELDFQAYLYKG